MFKIITMPFDRMIKGLDEDILNRFVLNKHIKDYRIEFFSDSGEFYWTIFLEYTPMVEKTPENILGGLDETQKMPCRYQGPI